MRARQSKSPSAIVDRREAAASRRRPGYVAGVNAFEIPPDTTIQSLIESVVPALHAQLVAGDAPADALVVTVRIDGAGSWTVHIRGREMRVVEGEAERPTLWLCTTARAVEVFLEDAAGPRRFAPKIDPAASTTVLSDPRLVRRAAMAHGRIELALRDLDGERLSIVFGFGHAARKRIDPDDADVVVEAGLGTLERMLAGTLAPDEALADGDVQVRGNRMLALQLALAVAPFYPQKR
jgi:putative sterol carrier protein